MNLIRVIGGGLAGSEAAWQISRRGHDVELFEMRPGKSSEAHRTADLGELVCSNSLKSIRTDRASGVLKEEMRQAGSLIIESAIKAAIPGGSSLCVDRIRFSRGITEAIEGSGKIRVVRKEVSEIPRNDIAVVATGPLTSEPFSSVLRDILGSNSLFFYDAIAPTVDADTLARDEIFLQDRYAEPGVGAYLNCPMDQQQYAALVNALRSADRLKPRKFEDTHHFEACLPVEELAARGEKTLAFGPLRPVGLTNPGTGRRPYAVVQLRPENLAGTLYSLVGFQTRLPFGDQERILRSIPGLGKARFERLGTIHRNTYVEAPKVLDRLQRVRNHPGIFLCGQIAGVEGYAESAASGLMTGLYVSQVLAGTEPEPPPATTMTGAILGKLAQSGDSRFQPVNAQFGLLPPLDDPGLKKDRKRAAFAERALKDMSAYLEKLGIEN